MTIIIATIPAGNANFYKRAEAKPSGAIPPDVPTMEGQFTRHKKTKCIPKNSPRQEIYSRELHEKQKTSFLDCLQDLNCKVAIEKQNWHTFLEQCIICGNTDFINDFINSTYSIETQDNKNNLENLRLSLRKKTLLFMLPLFLIKNKSTLGHIMEEDPSKYGVFLRSQILILLKNRKISKKAILVLQKRLLQVDAYLASFYAAQGDIASLRFYLHSCKNIFQKNKQLNPPLFGSTYEDLVRACRLRMEDPSALEALV